MTCYIAKPKSLSLSKKQEQTSQPLLTCTTTKQTEMMTPTKLLGVNTRTATHAERQRQATESEHHSHQQL